MRGSTHADLWAGLRIVFTALDETGAPPLALPALNSFLWSKNATPDILSDASPLEIANRDLLPAFRALAFTTDGDVKRPTDFRNLGAEDLSGVYESLLELAPDINPDAGDFDLRAAGGNERKTTGSYYTPSGLISCLLDSALDPILDAATAHVRSQPYRFNRLRADAWCAAFVWKKTRDGLPAVTQEVLRDIERNPFRLDGFTQLEIEHLAKQYQFFHWHLAFPEVFDPDGRGGFDCVLGNPPWEMVVAGKGKEAQGIFARVQNFYNLNQYAILAGRRDLYKLFLVQSKTLLRANGSLGMICPLGVFIEEDSIEFREQLFNLGSVTELRHFQNHGRSFFTNHSSYRFCGITYSPIHCDKHCFSTIAKFPENVKNQFFIHVKRESLKLQLGDSFSKILYPEENYARVHQQIIKKSLLEKCLKFHVCAEFHSSTDKKVIHLEKINNQDWVLLKNRNIHQYNYQFAPPEVFVDYEDVKKRLLHKNLEQEIWLKYPRLIFRDIARNDDERTLIACLALSGNLSSYDTPMLIPSKISNSFKKNLIFYCGLLNSFLADFLIRPFVDKHIKGYILNKVPWINIDCVSQQISLPIELFFQRIFELVYTNDDFKKFAEDCGYAGEPFAWDEERRFALRCELDAAFFHLYGVNRDDAAYILETFPIVWRKDEQRWGEYRTKRVILEVFDDMARAATDGAAYRTRLDPPPANGWTPPVSKTP
jgi:hypothetical protein